MPRPLGQLLVVGGVGYALSALLGYLAPEVEVVVGVLTVPATVGELWMVGYLLVRGVRRHVAAERSPGAAPRPVAVESPV
ncbi:DUF4386 family protein [Micromonospora sp. KC723]|uniref:DUF4386 family protein n=1 Tax=Micromonospora sp. KC723 TaxID=2530381 RepID=UPI00104DA1A6|nr:DUF4386 family protein [Micromonospora sp. KC723]TDB74287.1 DUF4386 family protein [Micromonospora sp. KC723]